MQPYIHPASALHNFLVIGDADAERACRECGCTNAAGCPPKPPGFPLPCSWVAWDLCSHCAQAMALLCNVATRAAGLRCFDWQRRGQRPGQPAPLLYVIREEA